MPESNATATKAWAAGGGGGVGAALAEIIVTLFPNWLPETLETSITVILTAILAAAATYYAPANTSKE